MNIKEIKDGVIMTLLLDEKDNLTLNYTNTKLDFVKNIYFKSNNETFEIQNIKIYHYISSHQQNKEKKNIPPFLF